jgi:aspartate aminotransferase
MICPKHERHFSFPDEHRMLDKFQPAKADPILGLGKLFQADPRDGKIDLGVGVYKDASGKTPIVRAVKQAETILHQTQTSKT